VIEEKLDPRPRFYDPSLSGGSPFVPAFCYGVFKNLKTGIVSLGCPASEENASVSVAATKEEIEEAKKSGTYNGWTGISGYELIKK